MVRVCGLEIIEAHGPTIRGIGTAPSEIDLATDTILIIGTYTGRRPLARDE